jgi:hypothetical protein
VCSVITAAWCSVSLLERGFCMPLLCTWQAGTKCTHHGIDMWEISQIVTVESSSW